MVHVAGSQTSQHTHKSFIDGQKCERTKQMCVGRFWDLSMPSDAGGNRLHRWVPRTGPVQVTPRVTVKMWLRAMACEREYCLSTCSLELQSVDSIYDKQFLCSSLTSFRYDLISCSTQSGFCANHTWGQTQQMFIPCAVDFEHIMQTANEHGFHRYGSWLNLKDRCRCLYQHLKIFDKAY